MNLKDIFETFRNQVDMNRNGYEQGEPDHYDEILRDAIYTVHQLLPKKKKENGNLPLSPGIAWNQAIEAAEKAFRGEVNHE